MTTYIFRTNAFDRRHDLDEGFEFFAIDLDGPEIENLRRKSTLGANLAAADADLRFVAFADPVGRWLPCASVPKAVARAFEDRPELPCVIFQGQIGAHQRTREQTLTVTLNGVCWSCNTGDIEADWLIDTATLNRAQLDAMLAGNPFPVIS